MRARLILGAMRTAAVVGLAAVAIFGQSDVSAPSPEQAFYNGISHFERKDYQGAIAAFESATSRGYHGAALDYNLGTAYLIVGRPGPAIHHLRLAARYAPRDPDIRRNLKIARSRVRDRIARPEPPAFVRALLWPHRMLTTPEEFLLFSLLWIGGFGLLHVRLLLNSPWLTRLAVVCLLAGTPLAVSITMRESAAGRPSEGVILTREADVFTGPSETAYSVYFQLHEGAEVLVTEVQGDWVRIEIDANRQGYVPRSQIGLL